MESPAIADRPICVTAIVPAAGESRRMGTLKPLLPFGPETVLQSVIRSLNSCPVSVRPSELLVVLGHRAAEVAESLTGCPVVLVYNPDYRQGMLSSLQTGIRAARPDTEWYLIALGDQPELKEAVITRLLQELPRLDPTIGLVLPTFQGKRGHPLLIRATLRDEILGLDPDVGLRELRLRHPDAVREVPVEEGEILLDLDTPAEYQSALERIGTNVAS